MIAKKKPLPTPPEGFPSWGDLELRCASCGASLTATPYDITQTCSHCGSLLLVRGDAADIWVQRPAVTRLHEVSRIIKKASAEGFALYRRSRAAGAHRNVVALEERAEALAEALAEAEAAFFKDESGDESAMAKMGREPPSLFALLETVAQAHVARSRADEARASQEVRVLSIDRFYLPFAYWDGQVTHFEMHTSRDLTNRNTLRGEWRRRVASLSSLAMRLDERNVAIQRFSLVRPEQCEDDFLWVPADRERPTISADPARNRSRLTKFSCLVREVTAYGRWQATVFRPYVLAHVHVAGGRVPVLIDAHAARIVSCPDISETTTLLTALSTEAPRRTVKQSRVLASRCPRCGAPAKIEPQDVVTLCRDCGSGLRPGDSSVEVVPVHIAVSPSAAPTIYVPFWRFRMRLTCGDETISDLEKWSGKFRLAKAFSPKGDHVFVPAMPWLGTTAGDLAFAQACRSVHFDPPAFGDSTPPPPEQIPTFFPFRLDPDTSHSLGRTALLTLFEPGPAVRLTAAQMDRLLLKAGLELDDPAACYVPFFPKGKGAERGRFTLSPLSLAPLDELGRPKLEGFRPTFLSRSPALTSGVRDIEERARVFATAAATPRPSELRSLRAPRRRS